MKQGEKYTRWRPGPLVIVRDHSGKNMVDERSVKWSEFVDISAGLSLFLDQLESLKMVNGVALSEMHTTRLKEEILRLRSVKAMSLKQVGELLKASSHEHFDHCEKIKQKIVHGISLLNRDAEYYRNLRLVVCPQPLKTQLILESVRCRLQNEICLLMTAMHLLRFSNPEDPLPYQASTML